MDIQINSSLIDSLSKKYNENLINKLLENAIVNNGIIATSINRDALINSKDVFNIDLGDVLITDQKESSRCWVFAGLNMFKRLIAENLNIDPRQFELSQNYLIFWDKLERANNTYENIINIGTRDFSDRELEYIMRHPIPEGGLWNMFVALINKYGIMPKQVMPETYDSENSDRFVELLTEKVKKDILILRQMLLNKESLENIRNVKCTMLEQIYTILCKTLSEPPRKFDYEYKDKDGNCIILEQITPIEFRDKYLNKDLNDYVALANVPMPNRPYNKVYKEKFYGNVHEISNLSYLNLTIDEIKDLAIKQLKDGEPLWFTCDFKNARDVEKGILDSELYKIEDMLGFKRLTKEEKLITYDIEQRHAMVLSGVNICNGKPDRWKVEDSYSEKVRKNGYYIMNDNFFTDYVLQIIVHKKHLSAQQLELLNQEPILFSLWDPMA